MKDRIVVDGSVVIARLFHDERDDFANDVARQYRTTDFHVPILWRWEIANTLLMGERRKRCSRQDISDWLNYLSGMPFRIDEASAEFAWSDTLDLARNYRLTVYDAAYLELALRESVPLATFDAEMKAAAEAAAVSLFRLRTP